MKNKFSIFAIALLAVAVPAAHASVISVNFSGVVSQIQGATGQAVGNTVTGHFDVDTVTGNFLDYTIAGKSVATGYLSSATIGPALTDAIYMAQVSPVALGTPSNSSFSLDLSAIGNWPSTDTAFTLLLDKTQLPSNLDTVTFPSTFGYYTANANGTNVISLSANLTSISATAVPEPTTLALLASSLVCLGFVGRHRRRS